MTGINSWKGRRSWRPFFVAAFLSPIMLVEPAFAASAVMARQSYVITNFDSIRVEAPVRVEVVTGGGVSARGEGDRRQLDRVDLQVSGGLLSVRMRANPDNTAKGAGVPTLYLSTGPVRRAVMIGGGVLTIDRMSGQSGVLSISGNGDMLVRNMALDKLDVQMSGAGRLTLAGKAGKIDIRTQGAGAVASEGLVGRDVAVYNDGPGAVSLSASGSALVSSSGSGDTIITGTAACSVKQRGSGRVQCGGKDY
jgi:hypothetical protein